MSVPGKQRRILFLLYICLSIFLSTPSSLFFISHVPGVGYGNVAATVGSQFAKKIRLGAKVTAINYEDTSNALITFTNKNGVEHQVAAKTVLVTVPLGVLKAGTIKFTPSLPDWKQERIDKMGE